MNRYALLAATSLFALSGPAFAADLGGDCCADLEERVAELEATTARKGNRKVSLTVSGHVNEAIAFYDAGEYLDADGVVQPGESNAYVGTHNVSRSRFRFKGNAQINADWSAGFLMEFGVRRNDLSDVDQDDPRETSGIDIRHEALYIKSKTYGTLWLGWSSAATDGITEICLGCGFGNVPDYSNDLASLLTISGGTYGEAGGASGVFAGEGDRGNVVRYISPTFAGFSISTSFGDDDYGDVALRYAGEFGAIRVAAGVGYSEGTNDVDSFTFDCSGDDEEKCTAIGASASLMHVPTGLYIAGAYGEYESELTNQTDESFFVTVGLNQKFISLGKTNFHISYGESEREIGQDSELTTYGVGIEQDIDAAAMNTYLYYRRFEAEEVEGDSDADIVMLGARIKF